jgi:hypothetical protein
VAQDLALEFWDANGTTLLFSKDMAGLGSQETLDWTLLTAGTYTVRIVGSNGGDVQRYNLWLSRRDPIGGGLFPSAAFIARSGETRIRFLAGEPGVADITVYDVQGRAVRELRVEVAGPGWTAVGWDGRDAAARVAPSGIYFIRVELGHVSSVLRVARVR